MNINDLIQIANALDSCGLHKDADYVDGLIKSASGTTAINDFYRDLKNAFISISNNPAIYPTINQESVKEIVRVIESVASSKSYSGSSEIPERLTNPAKVLGDNFLATYDNLEKIKVLMAAEKDPEKLRLLDFEKRGYDKDFENIKQKISVIKAGRRDGDSKIYVNLKEYLQSRGHSLE